MNIDLNSIDTLVKAVKLAQSRGSFLLEESAQLYPVVSSIEAWVSYVKKQSDTNTEDEETEES